MSACFDGKKSLLYIHRLTDKLELVTVRFLFEPPPSPFPQRKRESKRYVLNELTNI